jgi:hypothetical protein
MTCLGISRVVIAGGYARGCGARMDGGAAHCAAAATAPAADWEHEKQVSQEAAAAAATDRATASLTVAARRRRRSSEDGRATDVAKFRQSGLEMMVVEGAPSLSPWLLLVRVSTVELYDFVSTHI